MNLAFLVAIVGAKFLRVVDFNMDTFHKRLCSVINHTHKPPVNVFLASSVGCKIEPSSGHYTRTVKTETPFIVRREYPPFTLKDALEM
jgi:hypothetical protein